MEENKRGLSTIVITLILILLSLVAVGVVWVVINNVIKSGTAGVDLGAKCLDTNVEATAVKCIVGNCNVTLSRTGTGTGEIGGVKLVFRESVTGNSSSVIGEAGNIEALAGKRINNLATGLDAPDKIEVTVYFEDASGNEQLCSQSTPFSF
jgi:hypothetical protein